MSRSQSRVGTFPPGVTVVMRSPLRLDAFDLIQEHLDCGWIVVVSSWATSGMKLMTILMGISISLTSPAAVDTAQQVCERD